MSVHPQSQIIARVQLVKLLIKNRVAEHRFFLLCPTGSQDGSISTALPHNHIERLTYSSTLRVTITSSPIEVADMSGIAVRPSKATVISVSSSSVRRVEEEQEAVTKIE
ncbi:hypothetical protein BLNAU_1027 [Blattamonas nauphoetae]|uniref:Uncharacterized protein n=1 Tax=Blattamonas nauphoetae TaxID=2049346 RepID=A0ABQ9YJW4_9EUKA|nr:hypothetical protein BLNAU_1027 [Blattamonas nauphoetae]